MTEPHETSAGEVLPEDVPDALLNAAFRATGYRLRGPDLRNIVAAVMTQLGLREQWGIRVPRDGEDAPRRWRGGEEEARNQLPYLRVLDPASTLQHRYVTDWEDADA